MAADALLSLWSEKRRLLVDKFYFNPPMDLEHILLRIKVNGYFPVLAYSERYVYMNEGDYRRLKSLYVEFQMNLPSIGGFYGPEVRKRTEWL